MLLLIVYDKKIGKLREQISFPDADINAANAARLKAEIRYIDQSAIEIVLIQSRSLEEMMKTHGRYFKTPLELLDELSWKKPT